MDVIVWGGLCMCEGGSIVWIRGWKDCVDVVGGLCGYKEYGENNCGVVGRMIVWMWG